MADKTVTVRPSGGNYTSLAAAIAGEAVDLVSGLDGNLYINIDTGTWTEADTTQADVLGFTSDASHRVIITQTSASYRLVVGATNFAFRSRQAYTEVYGLRVQNTSTGTGMAGNAQGTLFVGCIVSDANNAFTFLPGSGLVHRMRNCVAYGYSGSGVQSEEDPVTIYIDNCVLIGGTRGVYARYGETYHVRNTYAGGSSTADYEAQAYGTINFTTSYSEDGTRSTPTAALSTSTFINITAGAEDFQLVSGSALIDEATSLAADAADPFNIDILGVSRSGTWDVGPYEYASAPEPAAPTGLHTDAPTIGELDVSQDTGPYPVGIAPGAPTEGKPAVSQSHSVSILGVRAGAPVVGKLYSSNPRIINHENYDPDALSLATIQAAARLKVYAEVASTGTDMLGDSLVDSSTGLNYDGSAPCGLALLYAENSRYLCGHDYAESANDSEWFGGHTGLQVNRRNNPPPATKLSGFLALSEAMRSAVNVAFWKNCWIDVWPETTGYVSDGAAYAASVIEGMEAMGAANPGLTLVYVTMPLQADASYAQRDIFNPIIRAHVAATPGTYLLDWADIESYDAAGVHQLDGDGREIMAAAWAAADGGHLSTAGRLRFGRAYWALISQIATDRQVAVSPIGITSQPTTGRPAIGQAHSVILSGVASRAPTLGKPSATQARFLSIAGRFVFIGSKDGIAMTGSTNKTTMEGI